MDPAAMDAHKRMMFTQQVHRALVELGVSSQAFTSAERLDVVNRGIASGALPFEAALYLVYRLEEAARPHGMEDLCAEWITNGWVRSAQLTDARKGVLPRGDPTT